MKGASSCHLNEENAARRRRNTSALVKGKPNNPLRGELGSAIGGRPLACRATTRRSRTHIGDPPAFPSGCPRGRSIFVGAGSVVTVVSRPTQRSDLRRAQPVRVKGTVAHATRDVGAKPHVRT